jgi:DNA topoisomerase I
MASFLVILESPGKVKKISNILGGDYKVVASVGHFRKLADSGEDSTGVSLKSKPPQVKCDYTLSNGSSKIVKSLQKAVNRAEEVFIATDPDREGECIAWHLIEALKWKSHPLRISFSEITEKAVKDAIANPRPLDENMVASARARSCLDKIFGYKVSPLLWEMQNGAKSAGRCQSAALRLLCRRESQIQRFVPENFWKITAKYKQGVRAVYVAEDGSSRIKSHQDAQKLAEQARTATHFVENLSHREVEKNPPSAFKTSTLQQEAGRILGLGSSEVMQLAQDLYEAGYITYHRSDSVILSPEFEDTARDWLQRTDPENLPKTKTQRRDKAGTQGGHEAIRPVDACIESVPGRGNSLYQLIRNRAIASLCKSAIIKQSELVISSAGKVKFETAGKRVVFLGYGKYWDNLGNDSRLPKLEPGQELTLTDLSTPKGQTKAPSRFSESKLIQELEQKGIGRPSTFSSIVETLLKRGYVQLESRKLIPTSLGKEVDEFLQRVISRLIEPGFTCQMEKALDAIANGSLDWQQYLIRWHDQEFLPLLKNGEQVVQQEYALPGDEPTDVDCHFCGNATLTRRYSNSPKLEIDHYLVCPECDSPHFWNDQLEEYQLPYKLRIIAEVEEDDLTEFKCPECGSSLQRHEYEKNGQTKAMLRCWKRSKQKCSSVAYFPSKYGKGWWSKKYGELFADEDLVDFQGLVDSGN